MEDILARKYWLRQWVYTAFSEGHLIFLDVMNDRYYLIPRDEAFLVESAIYQNGEDLSDLPDERGGKEPKQKTIEQMVKNGLITDKREAGKSLSPCIIEHPVNRFEHTESDVEPIIRWHHVINGILLGILTHLALRFMPLRFILKLYSHKSLMPSSEECERKSLKMAALYRKIRPFLFRSRLCLYDTLVFAGFCRIYGFFPTIVFGVKGEPFEAHCWAQWGTLILNDSPQNTGQYTPIMTI